MVRIEFRGAIEMVDKIRSSLPLSLLHPLACMFLKKKKKKNDNIS